MITHLHLYPTRKAAIIAFHAFIYFDAVARSKQSLVILLADGQEHRFMGADRPNELRGLKAATISVCPKLYHHAIYPEIEPMLHNAAMRYKDELNHKVEKSKYKGTPGTWFKSRIAKPFNNWAMTDRSPD